MREEKASVFLVEDDASVRNGLVCLLRTRGYQTTGFASAEEFLDARPDHQPACLVLDVTLPGLSGFELQDCLAQRGWFLPIIFVTAYGDIPMAVRAIKAGAAGFLTKPFREEQLVEEIDLALAAGGRELKARSETVAIRKLYETLTAREAQVMALVTSGRLNKQTASELGIVENTVKVHRRRVMRKMRARSLADLVLMAQKLGAICEG